ncbi:MAG: haloacid dehalogenase type II [Bacteroidota bacterium]
MISDLKAIVFDAYGTLFDVKSIDAKLAEHFGKKAGELSNIWRSKQLEYTWLRTLMGRYVPFTKVTEDALVFATQRLNIQLKPELTKELMDAYLELTVFEEVLPNLKALSAHCGLAVLSNADLNMLDAAVRYNQIDTLINHIFSADKLRLYKPSPPVYQMACDGLNLEKHQIGFVSSNTWDIAGATSFGFRAIWLDRKSGTLDQLDVKPHRVVQSLDDLVDIRFKT